MIYECIHVLVVRKHAFNVFLQANAAIYISCIVMNVPVFERSSYSSFSRESKVIVFQTELLKYLFYLNFNVVNNNRLSNGGTLNVTNKSIDIVTISSWSQRCYFHGYISNATCSAIIKFKSAVHIHSGRPVAVSDTKSQLIPLHVGTKLNSEYHYQLYPSETWSKQDILPG